MQYSTSVLVCDSMMAYLLGNIGPTYTTGKTFSERNMSRVDSLNMV